MESAVRDTWIEVVLTWESGKPECQLVLEQQRGNVLDKPL